MELAKSQLSRKYGAFKDKPDFRDLEAMRLRKAVELPSKVDLEEWCGPKKDQMDLGACTGFAGTGMREFLFRRYRLNEQDGQNLPNEVVFSPMYLYWREREHEGTVSEDNGAEMRSVPWVLRHFGTCLESQDVYQPKLFTAQPTAEQTAQAYQFHSGAYHRLSTVQDMKSCLGDPNPYVFVMGFAVYESFERKSVAKTGLMPIPDTENEMPLGGHAVCVIGYDDSVKCPGAKPGAFKIRNSWGADWGDKGNFWMPYEVAANRDIVWDCWIQHHGRAW